ncbi:phosphoglycolate phosphatase [Hasllibacter halocynthiae]|uniref:phosphoglycolate phosphatase n=1 Tax=Hasllibacter halocynthiae TaxID=595589 RepID=A0A2T0X6U3_9RHOB|nr:HAD family hydrolase [Hasllibacter halocynthiae]PRY94643.1 phosphoglycolate phosphatase [Hasllibacter halocynthiae]
MTIRGILFDKDGTLFDFQRTWGPWAVGLTARLAEGSPACRDALRKAMKLDPEAARFASDSTVVAGTVRDQVALLLPHLPGWTASSLEERLNREAASVDPIPATDLPALMAALRARGLALGVATNDGEASARRQLRHVGIEDAFDWIAGYDSGWGAKPAPGQIEGFLAALSLPAGEVLMVGDALHDLRAAKAAGTPALGVLTGAARRADLAPHAMAVLNDVGALPGWLDARADRAPAMI